MPAESAERLLERERELAALGDALTRRTAAAAGSCSSRRRPGSARRACSTRRRRPPASAGFTCPAGTRQRARARLRLRLRAAAARAGGRAARREPERDRLFEGCRGALEAALRAAGEPLPSASFGRHAPSRCCTASTGCSTTSPTSGPVALSVDDLHWSDPESLRFLNYLAPRLDGLPLAVLASDAQRRGRSRRTWPGWRPPPRRRVLRPGPLSIEATARLCERRLGAAVGARVRGGLPRGHRRQPVLPRGAAARGAASRARGRRPRGGPRAATSAPPRSPRRCSLRLSSRPAAATALVRAVAVLGDGASLAEAAGLAELAEDEAAGAADLLVALAILEPARAPRVRPPDRARGRLRGHRPPRARRRARARGRDPRRAAARSEERIAAQIVEAEPAGDPERVELLRRVAADALRARRAGRGRRLALGGRWRSRRRPRPRAEVLARARLGGAPPRGAGGGRPPRRGGRAESRSRGCSRRRFAGSPSRSPCRATRTRAVEAIESGDRGRRARRSGAGAAARGGARGPRPAGQPRAARPGGEAAGAVRRPRGRDARRAPGAREPRLRAREGERVGDARRRRTSSARSPGGGCSGEQEVDVAGPFYLLLVGPARHGRARRRRRVPGAGARRRRAPGPRSRRRPS